jgi:glycosyltransferase involved in cell wall biosynthesis
MGFPSALLAALRKKLSPAIRLAYEIGDPARPLLATQARPFWQVTLAHQIDRRLPAVADRLVFRGSFLADYFQGIAPRRTLPAWTWLPDGVDCEVFQPQRDYDRVSALRRAHGLEGHFVVGLVGNIHHNPVHDLYYGWELAEALALLPADLPITGVVVGDGPGRPILEATRERLKLGDRLRLVGRVPHDNVPVWMNVFDVGLSTQTDDPVGWGRTTAKLPEYLASGTPVVCTDVGEAHRWLQESGQTLPYHGLRDEGYPARLAERLQAMIAQDLEPLRASNRDLALRLFDYRVLRPQIGRFLGEH